MEDVESFQYLKTNFPGISDSKLKEGIFVEPQVRELMKDTVKKQGPLLLEFIIAGSHREILRKSLSASKH